VNPHEALAAADSPFGLDNVPYGVFAVTPSARPRIGVRIGDALVDLSVLLDDDVFAATALNPFLARGREFWDETRFRVAELVTARAVAPHAVHALSDVRLRLPFRVADYVDFYACEHHAARLGRVLRPDSPALPPNWRHMPIGYHGRAGTIVVSGTDIRRPCGQRRDPAGGPPLFGPTTALDIEAELGFVVGTPSTPGRPVSVDDFADHVFGVVLVNDWSARDLQAWEYVPLGPFLGKSFATSISPWVVPLAALEHARVPGPPQQPDPLPYLRQRQPRGWDIDFRVHCNGHLIGSPPYAEMYWSPAQMLAHATVNGAHLRTGDLFASGTISGPRRDQSGSLIELTGGGTQPIAVGDRERTFLMDGDHVVISATAPAAGGRRIALGEVHGTIRPAPALPER
jgi:fumarylacetoacetase